jgi:HEPN domain-containing protein
MSEPEHSQEAQRWLRYAREDLSAALSMLEGEDILPRHVCWLAQQAGEKALKAVLIYLQIDFPRSHDLDLLRNLIPDDWLLHTEYPDLAELTEWAVEARYPGTWPEATDVDAQFAIQQAQGVYRSVHFGLSRRGFKPSTE